MGPVETGGGDGGCCYATQQWRFRGSVPTRHGTERMQEGRLRVGLQTKSGSKVDGVIPIVGVACGKVGGAKVRVGGAKVRVGGA